MLINTIYVNGGGAVISIVTGLYDCDGQLCVPFLESTYMKKLTIEEAINENGGE